MKVKILGTGTSQGIPVISCNCNTCTSTDPKDKRLRCSVLIEINDIHIVIDVGPDFRQQMIRSNNNKLDAVLITHEHNDHIIGLDDVRPYNYIQKNSIQVYAQPRVSNEIRRKFAYAFNDPYPGAPKISLNEITNHKPFDINSINIIPIPVMHGKLPILAYRINNFVYITDASFIAESEFNLLKDVDVLIINCLRNEKHHSHFNLEEAITFIKKVNPKKAYLTHISHHFEPQKELAKVLPENIFIAYDGLIIDLP